MLLTASQIAELLVVSARAVPGLMRRMKVPVVCLGPGRGLGNRWARMDVLEAIEAHKTNPGEERTLTRRRRQPPDPISGRSVKELMAELTGGMVKQ
jgi:hypothetical protein